MMSGTPRISIALCTYNGERFLRRQLQSYLEQTVLPFELVACDDASSDATPKILEEFALRAPFPVRIIHNDRNVGLVKNFSQAASLCTGDYVAFSDQDDIWLPDKLEACWQAMSAAEGTYGAGVPLMVHSDLMLIDAEDRVIAPSYLSVRRMRHEDVRPLKTLLVRNFVSGCASLCNRVLINESVPFPQVIMNHDGWVAMIAASRGRIMLIPEPKILFRQHGTNVTGTTVSPYSIKAYVRRHRSSERSAYFLNALLYQARELKTRLEALSGEVPPYLTRYIDALSRGGLLNAFIVLLSVKGRMQGYIPNLPFYYHIARKTHLKQGKGS